jgi:hypothetical protein
VRARLAAAAVGALLIAAVIVGFALSSNPPVAGQSTVEPIRPSVGVSAGTRQCQAVSRVPRGADRIRLVVAYAEGGARALRVEIFDRRGRLSSGTLAPPRSGTQLIALHPRTRLARRATLCFSVPVRGQVAIGGDTKRIKGSPKGPEARKQQVASLMFLRPGSASWFSQTGTIARRYANSQTGITGGWSLWMAILFAIAAGVAALYSVVALPGRES